MHNAYQRMKSLHPLIIVELLNGIDMNYVHLFQILIKEPL